MKKNIVILLCSILILGILTGCGEGGNVKKPEISAKDYDTRLSNMSASLNEKELTEISTMLINTKKEDFDQINGWYNDKDTIDNDALKKNIKFDGRSVNVTLSLRNGLVYKVDYSYENAILEDFTGYIAYNVNVGKNLKIKYYDSDTSSFIESEDEDAAIELLSHAVVNKERISLYWEMEYTNNNEDISTIQYRFSYIASPYMDIESHFASVSFY